MQADRLIELYPTLFHMADARNWPSIYRHGLLSVSALLDFCGVEGEQRRALESAHRPTSVAISGPGPEPIWIRDQHTLQEADLVGRLDGVTFDSWLRLLNDRVFFWTTPNSLDRSQKAYRLSKLLCFEVDTRRLLARHADRVDLSHVISGSSSAKFRPARRGLGTFVSMADYVHSPKNEIAELTVRRGVPDILECTIEVRLKYQRQFSRTLWYPRYPCQNGITPSG